MWSICVRLLNIAIENYIIGYIIFQNHFKKLFKKTLKEFDVRNTDYGGLVYG